MIDTHAHINLEDYTKDQSDILKRAWKEGLEAIIIPGIDWETSLSAYQLAETQNRLFSAVGIHPHHVHEMPNDIEEKMDQLLQKKKIVALGEVGLDYYRSMETREVQINALKIFFELSLKHKKPLIIHCRDAFDDLKKIADLFQLPDLCGVLHCFTGTLEEAFRFIDKGFMISLSGIVTFKNARQLKETVSKLPLEHMMIETDSPYLAPVPFRGKRNEPSYVRYVAEMIAEIKNVSFEEVCSQTSKNAYRLLGL